MTLPINKSLFKRDIEFIGMTEYFVKINKQRTIMLMHGEKFSVIPLTTHINLSDIKKFLNKKYLDKLLNYIIIQIQEDL